MKKINLDSIHILIVSILLLIAAGYLNEALIKPDIEITKQDSAINVNSDFLKLFNAGHSRLISDLLWIFTLLESDHEHYNKRDLNSWMYLRFKTIMTLDPLFLQNYQFGGKYLSIVKDDIYGAKEIYDKGLKQYPNDYELLFNAAYLYTFELKDSSKGYQLYNKVKDYPEAPPYFKTLTYKLRYEKDNNLELAFKVLTDTLKTETDKYVKAKIQVDLYAIRSEIDLKCLNNNNNNKKKKKNCNQYDLDGNRYIYEDGKYKSLKPFIKYGIKRKARN